MNILIVEDDAFLAEKIADVFRSKVISNRVKVLHTYLEFLVELPIIGSYDIVLTDLKLAQQSKELGGYKIIRHIREKNSKLPIVVISSFWDLDRLRDAFELGASDYIIKPIRLRELELRIFNWFKNYCLSNGVDQWKVRKYGEVQYDLDKNEFYYWGKLIPLTRKNKYVFSLFFNHPDRLLRESYLIEKIWWDTSFSVDRNLRVSILRLKHSLSPYGVDQWIQNVRGEGYMFSKK